MAENVQVNPVGSFHCKCPLGYKAGMEESVQDIKCLGWKKNVPNVNPVGSFHYKCPQGYKVAWDGRKCTGTARDGRKCTVGSFHYKCPLGYKETRGWKKVYRQSSQWPQGIEESVQVSPVGIFIIKCPLGYKVALGMEESVQVGPVGSFNCKCPLGYKVARDGRKCTGKSSRKFSLKCQLGDKELGI
ncbi:unnamed protein product [Mytilus edulis]|uniref:NOTCH1 EGF-like calcium-binding domain-containing protein n=1 Tax=Mytilus edulis TaxID=6550 RepID=A0A8S3STK6_MYTED|nr:unnamed protein product [Mytilus edulis]